MSNALLSQGAPVRIPRWEWRTFAPVPDCVRILDGLGTRLGPSDSREISLVCLTSSHDVSIRDGYMALKWRKQVGQAGLELWDIVLESAFPCSRDAVQRLFETWDVSSPELHRSQYTLKAFLEELIQTHPGLQLVQVDKHAESFLVDGVRCEWTHMIANQVPCECLCIEHEDPSLTLQVVHRLGLESRRTASYPVGLKAALNLDNQH